eukprot:TRINITY_DN15056_c0_g1_i2.p1 TRINITY_DN15056_c0_g1~~TRINITY_DN15056_c0_g1_i2.p1  ORF type:complete len:670 (-),score=82.96 TRINITY_DN15056_c0_g1_i2:14-2023(-)
MASSKPTVDRHGTEDSGARDIGGLRRRPVPVSHQWHVASATEDELDDSDDVFEDEQPSRRQEYFGILSEYVFYVLVAYCVCCLVLWLLESLGLVSTHFDEWSPVRWWHSNPHDVQAELYQNAKQNALTMAQFQGLKTWIDGNAGGWVSGKLSVSDHLSERGKYDRRLEVNASVDRDEILLKLPTSHVLSADFCKRESSDQTIKEIMDAQARSSEKVELAQWAWIAIYLILRRLRLASGATFDNAQFDFLLKDEYVEAALSYIPLFWHDEDLEWLNGTDLLNVSQMDIHAAIEVEYRKLAYLLPSIEDSVAAIEFKKWAMVVMSRAETLELPDRENHSHISPQLAILPLIDLVDHHLPLPDQPLKSDEDLQKYQQHGSHTNISYSADMYAVVLRARTRLEPSDAVTSAYGVRSNSDYLTYHGFTMPREWSDLTVCVQYVLLELPLPSDLPVWKSKFLEHSYRFAVQACPNHRSTPHVLVGAARFLVASEEDIVGFKARAANDPNLLPNTSVPKDEKFLHHGAREALTLVCDTVAQPPVCSLPLSPESERRAWDLIRNQTIARVAQHVKTIEDDNNLLSDDDAHQTLTVNQRHAVIVRREEKIVLRRWCAVAVRTSDFLAHSAQAKDFDAIRVLAEQLPLANGEPEMRPGYWSKLLSGVDDREVPDMCQPR